MPNVKVLKRYSLLPFSEVRSAVIAGDLLSLSKALDKHQAFFIRAGIYLILEKLKIITYRNLFKKTALILGTHQLPIEVLLTFFQSASNRYRLLKHFGNGCNVDLKWAGWALCRNIKKFFIMPGKNIARLKIFFWKLLKALVKAAFLLLNGEPICV